jgi:hypothetical protein
MSLCNNDIIPLSFIKRGVNEEPEAAVAAAFSDDLER